MGINFNLTKISQSYISWDPKVTKSFIVRNFQIFLT